MATRSLVLALLICTATFTHATPNRGTWFWGSTTVPTGPSPHGSAMVVGDSAKEDAEIAFMTTWGVTKVYGSYGNGPRCPQRA